MYRTQPLFKSFGQLLISTGETDIMKLKIDDMKAQLSKHRALMIRGFKTDVDIFQKFTAQFSTNFLRHYAPSNRPSLSADATVTGVVKGNHRLNLHGEMFYFPVKPNILFLNCYVPPERDGETTLCDAIRLYREISPKLRMIFENKKIKYVHKMNTEECKTAYGWTSIDQAVAELGKQGFSAIRKTDDGACVMFEHVTSAIVKTPYDGQPAFINSIVNIANTTKPINKSLVMFADGSPIPREIITEIDETGERICDLIQWQSNDMVVVDNTTLMHGRRAFEGQRSISSRFALSA